VLKDTPGSHNTSINNNASVADDHKTVDFVDLVSLSDEEAKDDLSLDQFEKEWQL